MYTMDHGAGHRRIRDTGIHAECTQLAFILFYSTLFYSLFYNNDMLETWRERKYVGPQCFWREGRYSVFATHIEQTPWGLDGLTGINIPLPYHHIMLCWWCPIVVGCRDKSQRVVIYGEIGNMQSLCTETHGRRVGRWQWDSTLEIVTWTLHLHIIICFTIYWTHIYSYGS